MQAEVQAEVQADVEVVEAEFDLVEVGAGQLRSV